MSGQSSKDKVYVKKELSKLFKSMNFTSGKFLADEKPRVRTSRRISTFTNRLVSLGNFSDCNAGIGMGIRRQETRRKSAGYAGK